MQPCPDVYDYPLMSENFTKELIEEMEHYGKWSDGQNKVDSVSGVWSLTFLSMVLEYGL